MLKAWIAASSLAFLAGCGEQIDESYSTYAEAEQAGAITRGWIPPFVPKSARDIRDSHNLDSNRQTLRFTVPPSQALAVAAGFDSARAKNHAGEFLRKHGFDATTPVHIVCSEPQNGVLAIDRKTGRAIYDTTVLWADKQCQRSRRQPADAQ